MKRIFALLVAVVLAVGMLPTAAFAAVDSYHLGQSGGTVGDYTRNMGDEIRPETVVYLDITDSTGKPVTRDDIRNDKIDVTVKTVKGGKVFKKASVVYDSNNNAQVKVEFVDYLATVDEIDFELEIYLTKNKTRQKDSTATLYGTFENEYQKIDSKDEYIYAGNVPVIEATENNRGIEVALSGDISIIARMNSKTKYYARASQNITASDLALLDKYEEIEMVYYLTTIGMNGSANKIRFNLNDRYYVYNEGLEYVGSTDDELAYSKKYYLASEKFTPAAGDTSKDDGGEQPDNWDEIPDDNDGDDDGTDNIGGGGSGGGSGSGSGSGGGTNPDTGVTGYANVAVVTGMLSLAVIGALTLKKKK